MLHNCNADGFESLAARYGGGRAPKFTLPQPQERRSPPARPARRRCFADPPGDLQAPARRAAAVVGCDLSRHNLYGHIQSRKAREFLAFCRYLRTLQPAQVRIAIVPDNFDPHLSTRTDRRVGD
ncbi:MAG: hypothetical protein M3445_06895 [Actinomycetota bacterium]|nr:hypothetical protein [Actinomycetota bacterium]